MDEKFPFRTPSSKHPLLRLKGENERIGKKWYLLRPQKKGRESGVFEGHNRYNAEGRTGPSEEKKKRQLRPEKKNTSQISHKKEKAAVS